MMAAHSIRTRLQMLVTLVILGVAAMTSLLASGARPMSAATARFALAGPVLAASPTDLTNCRRCTVTVSNKSSSRSLTWSAMSRGVSGVTLKPARGTLQPKGQVSVSITLPSHISCPASDVIALTGPTNSVKLSWSCKGTPTPTTTAPLSPTPSASPTQSDTDLTPTATSIPNSGTRRLDGNPPPGSGPRDSSTPSILLNAVALLLALLACALYLISAKASPHKRLLSLILPVSLLRRLGQNR